MSDEINEKLLKVVRSGRNRHDLATINKIASMIVKGLMATAIIVLSVLVFYFATTQRIVMQPPFKIDKPITLNFDEEIDRPTVERMGEILTSEYKTVTPQIVKKQHDKILSLVPSSEHDKVADMFFADERSVIQNNLVRTFFIHSVDTENKGEIIVSGVERISVNGKEISTQSMKISWLYNFTAEEGFVILGYKEEQSK